MIDDLGACDDFIFSTLSGDATLTALVGSRIYPDIAPQGAALPYIVYVAEAGDDIDSLGMQASVLEHVYWVKAHGTGGSYASLRPIIKRVFRLLHGVVHAATDTDGDTAQIVCMRLRPRRTATYTDDTRFNEYGAEYRLIVQPTLEE